VARTITEDLVNADALYLGTERGLFATADRGREWHRVKANLPTVPICEITLHPRENDMLVATHGRGIWILDDLTPFQEYTKALSTSTHLFPVPVGVQRNPAGDRMRDFEGNRQFFGENPSPARSSRTVWQRMRRTWRSRCGTGGAWSASSGDDDEGQERRGDASGRVGSGARPCPK
jgi:hypothetical protein